MAGWLACPPKLQRRPGGLRRKRLTRPTVGLGRNLEARAMALNHVTLDDKYDLSKSRIFVTGFQALVRLCLVQKELDRRAGLNTAGYVTGYRGSPLGTLDQQFIRARRFLDQYDVKFQAGI